MKHRLFLVAVFFLFTIPVSISAQAPRYARVISENANLRDTPSVSGVSEQEVAEGTVVKVLDEKLPWYVVRVVNRVGWMHGNAIEFIGTPDASSGAERQETVVPDYQPSAPPVPRRQSSPETVQRTTSGNRSYIRGPRGGCYYYSGSGRKVYVDRSLCN